ncbi:MAG: PQQ-binding-like beta-propeller repeat protein [Candidatus Coatesbacteria bacterium]|nr:PQQ-binding-like beta-propeller repeat protein [Candidatus Coatesbacteria bacterium]
MRRLIILLFVTSAFIWAEWSGPRGNIARTACANGRGPSILDFIWSFKMNRSYGGFFLNVNDYDEVFVPSYHMNESKGYLAKLDAYGKQRWTRPLESPLGLGPFLSSNSFTYIITELGGIYGFTNAGTRRIKSNLPLPPSFFMNLDNGRIVCGSSAGMMFWLSSAGTVTSEIKLPELPTSYWSCSPQGFLYGRLTNRSLVSLTPQGSGIRWKFETSESGGTGYPILNEDIGVVLITNKNIYYLTVGGQVLWKKELPDITLATLWSERLLVVYANTVLYAFEIEGGEIAWKVKTPFDGATDLISSQDGYIYLAGRKASQQDYSIVIYRFIEGGIHGELNLKAKVYPVQMALGNNERLYFLDSFSNRINCLGNITSSADEESDEDEPKRNRRKTNDTDE